jgi:hypothetical protein
MGDITYTSGTGQFFVQRYVPAKRSWRLLSAPFNPTPSLGTHSISEAWQERSTGLNYTAAQFAASIIADTITTGFSTHITGGSTLNGFDSSPTNYTGIRYYDAGSWLTPGNVNGTSVNSKEGWMLFVRGDRKSYGEITNQLKSATITTLRPRGEIYLGNKSITSSNMTVVGNPYASAVDYTTVTKSGTVASPDTYTMWDPNLTGNNGVGGFVTLTWNAISGAFVKSVPSSIDSRYIPSGAAIMVDFGIGSTGNTLTFKESDKVSSNTTTAFRPVSPVKSSMLQTALETVESDTSCFVSDGNLVLFGDDFSNAIDMGDARKVDNFSENFGMLRDGKILSIERKNFLTGNDTIFYSLQNMRLKNYRLQFNMENIEPAQGTATFFEDLYLRKKDPVNLNEKYSYNFKISNDSGSFAPNRFRLVFKPSVVYNEIQAYISNENNLVEWKVAEEYNLSFYEVERSLDGVNFSAMAKIICGADNMLPVNYSWADASPLPAVYYYRIKSTSKNNVVAYSKSVKLTRVNYKPTIYIFPNPITSNTIHIQMNKVPEGIYSVRLMNTAGQVLMSSTINHPAGVATHIIKPAMRLAKGLYQIEITNAQQKSTILTALIQ